ncbi:MAG: hypothetical protein NVSMB2_22500 [Chloroflexota bacterium]
MLDKVSPLSTGADPSVDERIRAAILSGQRECIAALLDASTAPAADLVSRVVRPALGYAIERFRQGQAILPDLLQTAEVVQQAAAHLGLASDSPLPTKGTVVVATVEGDVHDIGKALLVTFLSAHGYTVLDLGTQVPVSRIVNAAIDAHADAIGLSALLVSTSKQMPVAVRELDRRGARIPVLIGGAAINASFGRRAAILPDGRIYEPGVFYCKDVFEGLTTMDALADPVARVTLLQAMRAASATERDHGGELRPAPRPRALTGTAIDRDVRVPVAPFFGARRLETDLASVWPHLDRKTLFRYHWGGYRARADDYERLVSQSFEPELERLLSDAVHERWLEPLMVSGYYACNGLGDSIVVFDPRHHDHELMRLDFPRQSDGERLCLSDYVRPLSSGQRDVIAFQAVSTGPRAGGLIEDLQRAGEYRRMLLVNGLASATAEALADYGHAIARRDLGLAPTRGLRFSWGYAACPDLAEQRKVLQLLDAEREIGLRLTLSDTFDPEHSTAALIVHHPQATYFSVFGSG